MSLLKKIKRKYNSSILKAEQKKLLQFATAYIKQHDLEKLLERAEKASTSTGTEITDYAILHNYILQHKPTYILECGTGKSTWVLADAVKKNYEATGVKGKIVSMESIKEWHEQATSIFPEEFKEFVEITYSPVTTYQYSIIRGTAYTHVPDYPYDLVFVDGPELTITEGQHSYETANMDLIRYLLSTDKSVTAFVDCRMRTCVAYGNIFGREKLKFIRPILLGMLENVSRKDMTLNNGGKDLWNATYQSTSVIVQMPSLLNSKV